MISIANPIYDVVFKYLMEDKRVARTILSALLKKDIVDVDIRPHEYTNDKGAAITMLRIDFGATVREVDGSKQLILIELQKTWIETETLRFRQYLGVQYENPKNMKSESFGQHALPMVAVYLLGHRVGDIEEPVLYVRHQAYDYNEQLVTKGMPDPFVESLTHDSIIVQIPLLHGQVNNRVEQVLSIFDQSYMDSGNRHVLNMDDSRYQGDGDMACIGTGEAIHALNRGENIAMIFINNAIYGMTGGQMAPTTLLGQKTSTCPYGRQPDLHGYPLNITDLAARLEGTAYVTRQSVESVASIMKAKKAIRKAFQTSMEGKGSSLVEIVSTCNSGWKLSPVKANEWMKENMFKKYEKGDLKDI